MLAACSHFMASDGDVLDSDVRSSKCDAEDRGFNLINGAKFTARCPPEGVIVVLTADESAA